MEAINKNKEEIEKMQKYVEDSLEQGEYNLNSSILESTIKTSILWCEFIIRNFTCWENQLDAYDIGCDEDYELIQQLQTHLNWLKEQEKLK